MNAHEWLGSELAASDPIGRTLSPAEAAASEPTTPSAAMNAHQWLASGLTDKPLSRAASPAASPQPVGATLRELETMAAKCGADLSACPPELFAPSDNVKPHQSRNFV